MPVSGAVSVTTPGLRLPPLLRPDSAAREAAQTRLDQLTKPPGSLGRLEELAVWLAGVQGRSLPQAEHNTVYVIAADHGVSNRGVSAYPREVTTQMVSNFLNGGAAINVLARATAAEVRVIDAGTAVDLGEQPGLIRRRMGEGTRDMVREPAMTPAQAIASIEAGIGLIDRKSIPDVVALGEMGIGNTTAASAVVAALLEVEPEIVTGTGTGISEQGRLRKARLIEGALRLHAPRADDALDVLSKVGGFEIGVLSGLIVGAASKRVAVVIDGFICGAAALIAVGLAPAARDFLVAAHQSVEPGHRHVLERLELRPLFDFELRLGEGTGAALALPILDASARLLSEMATFEEARVGKATGEGSPV